MTLCVTPHVPTQVRMHLLSSMGRVKSRRIGRHAQSAHKIAKHPTQPHVFFSSGEDGDVRRYDIRERNAGSEKVLTVYSATKRRVRAGRRAHHGHAQTSPIPPCCVQTWYTLHTASAR